MAQFDRILTAYEHRLRQLADDLVSDLDPSPEERIHLLLVTQLLQALVRTYESFQLSHPALLDASTSVMYATAGHDGRGPLNVPLRSLVDSGTLTPAQARFLNGHLGVKRSIIIGGGANSGKSTFLNALVGLLPSHCQMTLIRRPEEELPVLRGRASVVEIAAENGTPAREKAFAKAARMHPDWIVVEGLDAFDGPHFLEALTPETGGLATVTLSPNDSSPIASLALSEQGEGLVADVNPLLLKLERDRTGRPRLVEVMEWKAMQAAPPAVPSLES